MNRRPVSLVDLGQSADCRCSYKLVAAAGLSGSAPKVAAPTSQQLLGLSSASTQKIFSELENGRQIDPPLTDRAPKIFDTLAILDRSHRAATAWLEMARDVRVLRSAAAGSSAAETTKPKSSAAAPTVQSAPSGAALQPTPPKEPSKTERDSAATEVERAKAEAQTAKASEALAQRKLADAEEALQRAKEEAGQATAEAERAKVDAQGARESEAAAKRKLADAEAARAAAEQGRHSGDKTRFGLGGRLRRWLGRPNAPNP